MNINNDYFKTSDNELRLFHTTNGWKEHTLKREWSLLNSIKHRGKNRLHYLLHTAEKKFSVKDFAVSFRSGHIYWRNP